MNKRSLFLFACSVVARASLVRAGLRAALFYMVLGGLFAASSVHAGVGEYGAEWSRPVAVTLPEPTRTVVLQSFVDVTAWMAERGLAEALAVPAGRRSTLVRFPMSDEDWASQQPQLCGGSGVVACETSVCQAIQFDSEVDGADNPDAVKARVVRNAPPEPEQDPDGEDSGTCRNPMAAVPPGSQAGPGVHLELDLLGRDGTRGRGATARSDGLETAAGQNPSATAADTPGPSSASGAPSGPASGPQSGAQPGPASTAPSDPTASAREGAPDTGPASAGSEGAGMAAAAGELAFQLDVQQAFSGAVGLGARDLPADTTGYSLLVGEQCRQVRIPLDGVEPATRPDRLVAVVRAGQAGAIAASYQLTLVEETQLQSTGDNLVVYAAAANVQQALALMGLDGRVASVQREFVYKVTAEGGYSDPLADFTYGPRQTGALALHGATVGGGQTVAVIDTGVDANHPELAGKVEGLDFTGEGFSADAHGTAVAGIIAATADNAQGIYGVAPDTKILALKACQPNEPGGLAARCWTSSLVKALDAAMNKGANIINMSLAGPPDELVAKYVALAVSQNRLVIAGAGNNGPHAKPAFPAALPDVLAVTATDLVDRLYREANRGGYIDLAAPGVDIFTPAPDGNYPPSSGTSWAAAHVTGVAALVKDLVPFYGAAEIAAVLSAQARDVGQPGQDAQFGAGVVDACRAARAATGEAVTCASPADSAASILPTTPMTAAGVQHNAF